VVAEQEQEAVRQILNFMVQVVAVEQVELFKVLEQLLVQAILLL
jgi:hypothetical protein